jgi:hypothetical protein
MKRAKEGEEGRRRAKKFNFSEKLNFWVGEEG